MAKEVPHHKIEVEDYYDKIHRATWARRTAGLISGAIIGVVLGAAIGAIASFLPFVFGAMSIAGAAAVAVPTLGAVASTAAVFAGVIGLMGTAAMATVGADAASISAGMAEKERRDHSARHGGVATEAVIKDPAPEKMPKMFNWKIAAVTVPLMAAFGALIALSPLTASTIAMVGFQGATATAPASAAAIAASSTVFAIFGTAFGMRMSYITNKISNFIHKIITGKIFEKEEPQTIAAQPQPQAEADITSAAETVLAQTQNEPAKKNFSSQKTQFSLQGIIEKTEERSSDKDVLVTR